jgi:hypothetical protein
MYILLCGSPPFYGGSTQQIFRAVLHDALDLASPPWDSISPAAKDCVRRMLVRDPRRRATATEILQHEWMREQGAAQDSRELQPEILKRMKRFAGMNRLKKEALRVGRGVVGPGAGGGRTPSGAAYRAAGLHWRAWADCACASQAGCGIVNL